MKSGLRTIQAILHPHSTGFPAAKREPKLTEHVKRNDYVGSQELTIQVDVSISQRENFQYRAVGILWQIADLVVTKRYYRIGLNTWKKEKKTFASRNKRGFVVHVPHAMRWRGTGMTIPVAFQSGFKGDIYR